jgi:hypothetical protein
MLVIIHTAKDFTHQHKFMYVTKGNAVMSQVMPFFLKCLHKNKTNDKFDSY